ncbi:pav (predicted) [Pycnogonum litorale]
MKPIRSGKTPAIKTPGRRPPKTPRMNVKDPVEVYCRVRPPYSIDEEKCVNVVNETTIQLNPPESSIANRNGQKMLQNTFKYVFDENSTQKAVFDHVTLPLVDDLLKGKNGLLFAYGVKSSGKTFTMTGTPYHAGIMPRCLDALFNSISEYQARKYVFVPNIINAFDVQSNVDAMVEQHKELCSNLKTPKTPRKKEADDWSRQPVDDTKVHHVDTDNVVRSKSEGEFKKSTKASYVVSEIIAKRMKPFSDGEFVKECV